LTCSNKLFAELDDVEKISEKYSKKEKHPWEGHGRVFAGDFVVVMYGNSARKEGFVKEVTEASEVVVEETRVDPDQPSLIVEDQHPEAQTHVVNRYLFAPRSSLNTYF